MKRLRLIIGAVFALLMLSACDAAYYVEESSDSGSGVTVPQPGGIGQSDPVEQDEPAAPPSDDEGGEGDEEFGDYVEVIKIIDGDTIDILFEGQEYRVRYIGVNTPERDEPCYDEATAANAALVEGKTIYIELDISDTDQYGRLLRYVWVGETFVNAELVAGGWAEAKEYPPDTYFADDFRQLQRDADEFGMGCHPTGVFE